jgi:hypothetical protein
MEAEVEVGDGGGVMEAEVVAGEAGEAGQGREILVLGTPDAGGWATLMHQAKPRPGGASHCAHAVAFTLDR